MKVPFQEGKIVSKPWGEELWIADGVRTPYALKRILFKAGFRSSLQVHQFKSETNFVLSGEGRFQIWTEEFDTVRFLEGAMPQSELDEILSAVLEVEIRAGDIIDVKPGRLHRVIAVSDLTFIEASTVELDDVIRISDDAQRGHGKIEDEHGN
jgi:mannose-6-phosphate isomerase-like protein (cupin superfamily)